MADTQAVIDLMGTGQLNISTEEIEFDHIASGLDRLERGDVRGRLVAVTQ